MIDTLINITAVIGFVILCLLAFLGAKVLILAWSFSTQLWISEYKWKKLQNAKTAEEANNIAKTINKNADV